MVVHCPVLFSLRHRLRGCLFFLFLFLTITLLDSRASGFDVRLELYKLFFVSIKLHLLIHLCKCGNELTACFAH